MKFFQSLVLSMVLAVAALAQYPVGPNTGAANTPYSTSAFSATFNGPVTVDSFVTQAKTSTNLSYTSNNANVAETVVVRTIDHDIAVDYTSSDYYANNSTTGTVDNTATKRDVWEGHPFTYTFQTFTGTDGRVYSIRTRYIIVNAREALFISQVSLNTYADQPQWYDFEYSLRIR